MASITIQVGAEYATGTTVSVYNTVNSVPIAPVGSVVTTGIVGDDGNVTFNGLTPGINFLAYAVSGTPQYVRFYVPGGSASGGPSGPEVGTTLGQTTLVGGNPVIEFSSSWGIDIDGNAYYNDAGASAGESAFLVLATDGTLNLIQPVGVTP